MRTVLVTGANGFVGRHLCRHLVGAGWGVRASRRSGPEGRRDGIDYRTIGNIGPDTDWRPVLDGLDAVVHLAARVHILRETAMDPAAAFHAVNAGGSEALARQAATVGVRRFVLMSSIGARVTAGGAPATPYQRSKWAAERALARVADETGLKLVVLRPPLVYGPDAPGNVARLLGAIRRGLPLPFGAVHNRRSLLYVENLVDAVRVCLDHAAAPGGVFELSDGTPVSVAELVRTLAAGMGQTARLISVPTGLLSLIGRLTGQSAAIDALLGDLETDDRAIREVLGWTPPVARAAGLAATGAAWRTRP